MNRFIKYNPENINKFISEQVEKNNWLKKIKRKIPQKHLQRMSTEGIPLLLGSFLVGIVSVGYEKLFEFVEKTSLGLYGFSPYLFLVVSPLCFLLSYILVQKYAPFANGSGIPQLLASIEINEKHNSIILNKLLSFKIIGIKILSSLVLLLGGGSIGREGPTLHISGSIFKIISDFFPKATAKITLNTLIITGGASGLAAAFNTPLGGIVYVVEELSRTHINKLRTPVFTAVIIAGFTAQFFMGPYLFLGFPKVKSLPINLIHLGIILSILGGLMGAIFTKSILFISSIMSKVKFKKIFVLVLGLLFGILLVFTNHETLGTGKPLINEILFHKNNNIPWYTFPSRFIGSLLAFCSGGAGGIFATSLASGASLGHFFLSFFNIPTLYYNLLILMTMIAFLTSVTRTPFTASVLVLEMTDRHSAIFYFLMAGIIAQFIAELVQKKPIYEILRDRILKNNLITQDQ